MTGSARVATRTRVPALILALLAAMLAPAAAAAAPPAALSIEASLDPQRVAVGQEAQVTVVAEAQGVALPEFAFPPVPGLHVVRAADSQNFSWVNGHLSRTSTSVFLLSASAPGRYTIPPIRIASGAARAQTSPLVLEVGGAPSSSSGSLPPAGGGGEPPPSKVWGDESLPELFVRFVVDRRQVYWNQQVTARFLFYTRERLEEPPMWEIAEAGGFWKETLGEMRRGRVRVGNADYIAFEQDVAYFPTRTGKLKLGPGRVEARIMRRVDAPDPWSFLGFPETRVETIPLQTESVSIAVLPLPPGALPGFRGAVGQLVMDVKVDRLSARAGEPVTVTTVIRGEGNLNTAGDSDVAASLSLRSFESPATVTSTVAGYKIRGERRRDKAFVPEVPGRVSVLPIRFTWFDPEEGRYRTQVSDSIHVQVLPGGDSSAAAARPPEPPAAPRRQSGPRGALDLGPPAGAIALGAGSIAALAAAAAIAGARRRSQLDPKRRRRDALARIEGEMAALHAGGAARATPGASSARAASLLTAALGVRYGADIEGRPRKEALRVLQNAGADAAILAEADGVLDELERLAFAPELSTRDSEAFDRARALVRRLAEEKA